MHQKMLFAKWRSFCLNLNVLKLCVLGGNQGDVYVILKLLFPDALELLSHSGIPGGGGGDCFCTGSAALPLATGFCSSDNFWTTFQISFILSSLAGLMTWPIDYLIKFWSIFVVTLTLNFQGQIWNSLYLSQKWSDCHETKSKHIDRTLSLKCDHQIWPWLGPLHFQGQIWNPLYLGQKWSDCHETKSKHIDWIYASYVTSDLTCTVALTLNFQGQVWNLLYLRQKYSECHETKCKQIDWTQGLECDHQIWHWPWPWLWIFKVKFGICYTVSAKNSLIATKWNVHIYIELKASMTIKFDLGHEV